jgi:hypothetical protein
VGIHQRLPCHSSCPSEEKKRKKDAEGDKNAKDIGHQEKDGKGAHKTASYPLIRKAKKAVAKYRRICRRELMDIDTGMSPWSLLEGGREMIEIEYRKARDIVKKAIDAANKTPASLRRSTRPLTKTLTSLRRSRRPTKTEAERLLQRPRKIWQDARHVFIFHGVYVSDGNWSDSESEEEKEE